MHEECVSLQVSLSVVGALECVVQRCFGPDGGSVLFTRDTGEILITRHGERVLSTLHLEHPMARMVLECVCAHAKVTADGTKSFILLLAALLRGIRDSAHKHGKGYLNAPRLGNLAMQLLALSWKELDDVIAHKIIPYASSHYSRHVYKLEGSVLDSLVAGYIAGRVGIGQADALKRVLCEFYHKVSQDQNAEETVAFLHSHFPLLHTSVSGLPVGCSEVIEGLVVNRDWSVWTEMAGPLKALVVYESFGPCLEVEVGDNISVRLQHDWMSRTEIVLEQKLANLLDLNVCVVLSSVKQPEIVSQWARLKHVALLECVDSAQLDLLCKVSTTNTLPNPPLQHLMTLKFCSRVQLGGHRYACLGTFPQGVLQTHTLVLCAPAPGLLDQTVCVSQGVFTMLRHLCQSTISTQSLRNNRTDSMYDKFQCSVLDPSQSTLSAQDVWGRIIRAGGVLPVGGIFEFLLHHFLLNDHNHGDSEIRRILAEALLSVPRTLHFRRRFLEVQTHFLRDLKKWDETKVPELKFGLELNGVSTSPLCLESVGGKQQLVVSVLQCLNRLLCVGAILHTHRSKISPGPQAYSEEDEEGIRSNNTTTG
ncbi:Bardet-Biedl syndrome 10 protein [Xyrauchen texanus]|uniref:Bardet-Biedl syndrome 10 protein n=1 Tax=Xyrauchen texanus TaxID=154827 RepID=UPI002242AA28|nr:Bardet-Biedl syndrome 10 protein [Xyrauchen texanus]